MLPEARLILVVIAQLDVLLDRHRRVDQYVKLVPDIPPALLRPTIFLLFFLFHHYYT